MLLKRIKIDIENIASIKELMNCLTTKKSVKSFLSGIPYSIGVSGFFLQSKCNQIRN